MRDLMITLGHNSSAVVAEGSKLIAGFETERLTHVKSDSAFPTAVISRLNNEHGIRVFDKIFVGHWEPHNDVNLMSAKHWDPSKLPPPSGSPVPGIVVELLNADVRCRVAAR